MDTLYFIEVAGLKVRGKWFLETDRDDTRANVLDTIRVYGSQVIKVLEINEAEGTCADVTKEMTTEAHVVSDDYRTSLTGEDLANWQADRRRAIEMAE